MKTITVSETQRPTGYAGEWERGLDPWHADAFKGIDYVEDVMKAHTGGTPRKGGWFMIDWSGNAIGFVSDGTVQEVKE